VAALLSLQLEGKAGPLARARVLTDEENKALTDQALASLEQAFQLGWKDIAALRKDDDLKALVRTQSFQELLSRWEKKLR
jgi:hypothetical protein